MTPAELLSRLRERPMLLDGGLGTMLISMGLEQGVAPEHWIVNHPDRVRAAHARYVAAGSDVIHTVTFGASPPKLAEAGLVGRCVEINTAAVRLARETAEGRVLVAGDIGPTGKFLPPTGEASEAELAEAYREQAEALAAAGADLLSIETMYDVREALAAVRAAASTGLAVLCSMTFEVRRKGTFTFMGNRLGPSLQALHEAGATSVGCNCSVTSDTMVGMVEEAVSAAGQTPIVAQPNAGQPITTPTGIRYDANPDAFAADLGKILDAGARIVGGCCGTDEVFIRAVRAEIDARGRG